MSYERLYVSRRRRGENLGLYLVLTTARGPTRAAIEYLLHIDDDTVLSESMVFDEALFLDDPHLAAVAFPRTPRQKRMWSPPPSTFGTRVSGALALPPSAHTRSLL